MKLKGMVAKIDQEKQTMVVITEDKQFRRVPLPGDIPDLGSTIEISLPAENKPARSFLASKWAAVAAVLLLVLGISMFGYVGPSPVSASAYVTLDMTPSVRLAVNESGKVIDATALNEAGEELAGKLEVQSKDVYLAVRDAVKKAKSDGYFKQEQENLVLAAVCNTTGPSPYQIKKEKLRTVIHDELSAGRYPGYVVVNEASESVWQDAQKSGYSVNKAIFSRRVKEKGINIDPGALNTREMMQVINSSKAPVSSLFPENSCKVTWPEKRHDSGHHDSGTRMPGKTNENDHNMEDRGHRENNMDSKYSGQNNMQNCTSPDENDTTPGLTTSWENNHRQNTKMPGDERHHHND